MKSLKEKAHCQQRKDISDESIRIFPQNIGKEVSFIGDGAEKMHGNRPIHHRSFNHGARLALVSVRIMEFTKT